MPEVDPMKRILFLLATFSIQYVLGVQSFSGSLTKKGQNYYFTPKSSELFYKINSPSDIVLDSLNRLENGDFIIGNGTLDTTNKKINIESIDYVGLRKLLGPWNGAHGSMNFKDYSTMSFTPYLRDTKLVEKITGHQKEFRYSISPNDGNEWALFISDDKNTSFATVEFIKKRVLIKIFESESGKILRTFKLERP